VTAFEVGGTTNGPLDRVTEEDDPLAVESLMDLIDRLARISTSEHFLLRELELDNAYRQADAELAEARRSGDTARFALTQRRSELIFAAHDLVGLERIDDAIAKLSELVSLSLPTDDAPVPNETHVER
jgi:hypothetical protein